MVVDWVSTIQAVLQKYPGVVDVRQMRECNSGANFSRLRRVYLGRCRPSLYFTRRETQTMLHLLLARPIVAAAQMMQLSPHTLNFYILNMKAKLQARTRHDLINVVLASQFLQNLVDGLFL